MSSSTGSPPAIEVHEVSPNDVPRASTNSQSLAPPSNYTAQGSPAPSHQTFVSATTVHPSSVHPNSGPSLKQDEERKNVLDEQHEVAHQGETKEEAAVDSGPFPFKPLELAHLLDPKNLGLLEEMGGINGVLKGLGTDPKRGLLTHSLFPHDEETTDSTDPEQAAPPSSSRNSTSPVDASAETRQRVYGVNILPTRASKTLLQLMIKAFDDKVLILLSVAAVVSLALGLYQDFGGHREPGEPPVDWVEGLAIIIAIMIVVIVGSLNDWQKERQFRALNEKKEERTIKVIRDGTEKIIDVKDILVGDIALLEPGEIVPVDGIFLDGEKVKCDESAATGETDAIDKRSYSKVIAMRDDGSLTHETDCFILSGSKIQDGNGRYVVIAVGEKSFNGRIMMALRSEEEVTPLQHKLNLLATYIAIIGGAIGATLFFALLIRFIVQTVQNDPPRNGDEKADAFVNILIIAFTLVVVAVPEGLPLAVTLALAFATKRMTRENLLVRVLSSCETMANASVVCTDKTGTLTQNDMTVVLGSIGTHGKFVRDLEGRKERADLHKGSANDIHKDDYTFDLMAMNEHLNPAVQQLLNQSIALNTSAFAVVEGDSRQFYGNKTEAGLLKFAEDLHWEDYAALREKYFVNKVLEIPFSSSRKCMGVVIQLAPNLFRLYIKGASEVLLEQSTHRIIVRESAGQTNSELEVEPLDASSRENLESTILSYAQQMLRTLTLCYRDFDVWPPPTKIKGDIDIDDIAKELTFITVVGIEDPLRPGVTDAVRKCQKAGVEVKMCTGDNPVTARSISEQCGIFSKGGCIIEGPAFRKLNPGLKYRLSPRIQVLARSSPEDKQVLVSTLKHLGEIVGVTGDGTNDGPALRKANVGFSMGIAGTEVAKEASDIILMDDNFASIVKAIIWGRCVNDSVRKFLQFQISTNVTAVVITFVTAVASNDEKSVLSAVQLLWINIIMDTFAALALATDPATEKLLNRKPDRKTSPLFTVDMYKMILCQSIYQIIVIFIFHFLGHNILGYAKDKHGNAVIQTLVFNAFVFAQIFNSINCRRLDRELNIFEGILSNRYFILITAIEIAIQTLIVFVGGAAFQVTRIPGREWGISLALGVVSIPLGVIVRLLPSGPFEWLFNKLGLLNHGAENMLPTTAAFTETLYGVHKDARRFAAGQRSRSRRLWAAITFKKVSQGTVTGVLAATPGLMPVAIVAPNAYQQKKDGDAEETASIRYRDLADKIVWHPDTPHDDPVRKQFLNDLDELIQQEARDEEKRKAQR